jgi:hypothetical protein
MSGPDDHIVDAIALRLFLPAIDGAERAGVEPLPLCLLLARLIGFVQACGEMTGEQRAMVDRHLKAQVAAGFLGAGRALRSMVDPTVVGQA